MNIKNKKVIKQPPLLFKESQEILKEIEKETKLRMICYWTSSRGSVCDNDVIALYELLQKIGKGNKIGIFIKSYGGDIEASLKIVNLIRNYYQKVIALVPLQCASAATMIALGADEIRMGPLAYLTAIDSSLTHDLSPIDQRNNQAVGAIDRSSSLSTKICTEILSYHTANISKAKKISQTLNNDYPSHSYPITIREAKRIGLKAHILDNRINDLLLDLNGIYSEMAQKALTDYDEFNYHDNRCPAKYGNDSLSLLKRRLFFKLQIFIFLFFYLKPFPYAFQ